MLMVGVEGMFAVIFDGVVVADRNKLPDGAVPGLSRVEVLSDVNPFRLKVPFLLPTIALNPPPPAPLPRVPRFEESESLPFLGVDGRLPDFRASFSLPTGDGLRCRSGEGASSVSVLVVARLLDVAESSGLAEVSRETGAVASEVATNGDEAVSESERDSCGERDDRSGHLQVGIG